MSENKPRTVDDMLAMPEQVQRRLRALAEQQHVISRLLPPPVLSRRERLRRRVLARVNDARETLAYRIAPWLERP